MAYSSILPLGSAAQRARATSEATGRHRSSGSAGDAERCLSALHAQGMLVHRVRTDREILEKRFAYLYMKQGLDVPTFS